jgi:Sigma-70, region 4/Anti-sigma-K factor rskA
MRELDRLAPDQRAVLSLVLDREKSYEQVASMLGMSEEAVRERAHAALDALARDGVASGEPSDRPGLAGTAIVDGMSHGGPHVVANVNGADATSPRGARLTGRPGSRLGGALLLAALLAAIVVAAILISGSGGKGSGQASSRTSTTSATNGTRSKGSTSASAGTPKLDKSLPLTAVEPSSKAAGIAYVLSQGKRRAFYVRAEGMPPSSGFFYAVWLYDSSSKAAPLGRAPTVHSDGRMEGGGPLPSNAGSYHKIVITRETDPHASHPGEVVLSGAFALR